MPIDRSMTDVRLVLADDGEFHTERIRVQSERLGEYDRLIDFLREDPSVTRQLYIDPKRLAAAFVVGEDD